ncbi:28503_t:CDS:2, partial [Dentiscutata erythropus]
TITDKLIDNIRNIFFGDVSHIDDFGTFFKEVQIEEIEVKWNRFGQTTNDKKASKAPRMKLRGIYSEFGFRIMLNATSKDYSDFKVYKPPGPFIVTLTFLACKDVKNSVDRPININAKTKEVQNFCVCELYEYTFKIPMYMAHDGSQEPKKDSGMPFCLPEKPTSDRILSFGCDKQKGGFSLNIAWIVTITVDPSALQEKIENTLLANTTTNKDEPIDLEDALFFEIEQNMDNLQNLRLTGGTALQQLINAIKANNPILSQPNKSIKEKEKLVDLKPGSHFYNLIHKDIRLNKYMVSDLDEEIRVCGSILIQKFKEKIYNEKDYNQ